MPPSQTSSMGVFPVAGLSSTPLRIPSATDGSARFRFGKRRRRVRAGPPRRAGVSERPSAPDRRDER
jgi:hypothetical protein